MTVPSIAEEKVIPLETAHESSEPNSPKNSPPQDPNRKSLDRLPSSSDTPFTKKITPLQTTIDATLEQVSPRERVQGSIAAGSHVFGHRKAASITNLLALLPEADPLPPTGKDEQPSLARQFRLLLHRYVLSLRRSYFGTLMLLVQAFALALIRGGLTFRIGHSVNNAADLWGAQVITMNYFYWIVQPQFILYHNSTALIRDDVRAGKYTLLAVMVTESFVQCARLSAAALVYVLSVYFMIGFNDSPERFFAFVVMFALAGILLDSISLAMLYTFGAQSTLTWTPLIIRFLMFFDGYYIRLFNVPIFYKWLTWGSFTRYVQEILININFNDQSFSCESDSLLLKCPLEGSQLVDLYGYTNDAKILAYEALGLAAAVLIFRIIAYVGFRIRLRSN